MPGRILRLTGSCIWSGDAVLLHSTDQLIIMPTVSDLLAYAKTQARIEACDYFHPRYARIEEIQAWRRDRATRDRARRRVLRGFPGRIASDKALVPGGYGCASRLVITADDIEYTAGQYSAVEIWPAVLDYFQRTN